VHYNIFKGEYSALHIPATLDVGAKAWHRSRIKLVGEGRAGNELMGIPFAYTESTCGIKHFRVNVGHAILGTSWRPCEAIISELVLTVRRSYELKAI
jgi:hypothetical protein